MLFPLPMLGPDPRPVLCCAGLAFTLRLHPHPWAFLSTALILSTAPGRLAGLSFQKVALTKPVLSLKTHTSSHVSHLPDTCTCLL